MLLVKLKKKRGLDSELFPGPDSVKAGGPNLSRPTIMYRLVHLDRFV
jgi:hypothetical protein